MMLCNLIRELWCGDHPEVLLHTEARDVNHGTWINLVLQPAAVLSGVVEVGLETLSFEHIREVHNQVLEVGDIGAQVVVIRLQRH